MGYWAANDLVNYLPQAVLGEVIVTATSSPINASEFQTIINLVSAEFDNAAAQGGYVTPIATTAAPAYDYARLVVKHGAFWQLFSSVYVGDDNTLSTDFRQAYDQAIADLKEGNLTLSGAEIDPTDAGRLLPRGQGIASPWVTASWAP